MNRMAPNCTIIDEMRDDRDTQSEGHNKMWDFTRYMSENDIPPLPGPKSSVLEAIDWGLGDFFKKYFKKSLKKDRK